MPVELGTGRVLPPCTAIWKWKKSESEVAQSYPTLCDPMDCSLPGSSIHGIVQARVPEWVAISFSRGSSWPRDTNLDLPHCRRTLYHLSHQGSMVGGCPQMPRVPPSLPLEISKMHSPPRGVGAALLRASQCPSLMVRCPSGAHSLEIGRPASHLLSGCRFHAGDEQDAAHYGAGRGALHQCLRDHAHVLPLALLHPHREVRSQPQHLHQQWKLLLALLAGTAWEPHFCRVSQQHGLPDRWARLPRVGACTDWEPQTWYPVPCLQSLPFPLWSCAAGRGRSQQL